MGCTWDFYKDYITNKFSAGMSWDNWGEWHIDHIIPLAAANSESEIYAFCHYSNTEPIWKEENLSKNDDYNPKDKEAYLKWYYSEFPDKKP